MLKILQARLQKYILETAEELEIKLQRYTRSQKKQENSSLA